ncbi:MAG TPA: MerR family DNA-binding transcriptional regulator [Azospirillaceae bacterium]|nr:MerR family DNA-binding transcriptional regulator [Azospirillaceae bacterium]
MDELFTVNELAQELGITARTLRFYETKGLLSPQRAGTTRVYTKRDRARMRLILRGKRLGFSLAEIKEYLDLYKVDNENVEQQRLLLARVRERMAELEAQREDLEAAVAELKDIEEQVAETLKTKGVTT